MWLKWLPWKMAISKVAKAHGFLDPIPLIAHLRSMAQPSEVAEPIELLRAGVVMHARGLINSRVIQHNLDWVWPYWVESQFDPESDAFIPRAFSLTHINLTHRNWTAAGFPDVDALPLVDPRGLVTPHFDGWSIDAWIVPHDGSPLYPSRAIDHECFQKIVFEDGLEVKTQIERDGMSIHNHVSVDAEGKCTVKFSAECHTPANLVITLRPYNPEGVSLIHSVTLDASRTTWSIDKKQTVHFSKAPHAHHISDFRRGDIAIHLKDVADELSGICDVGMVTAAALFAVVPGEATDLELTIPLEQKLKSTSSWPQAMANATALKIPDSRLQHLYDTALRTLILCSPDDAVPGTYTYKRFWFRDAAFMIYALLQAGLIDRAERAVSHFFKRQSGSGYFHSQDGEWDSNGEALWTMEQLCRFKGEAPPEKWKRAIIDGANWIKHKRTTDDGLLPAGFSAEHLGPNDYYYWDDFWSVSGLNSAAWMCKILKLDSECADFEAESRSLSKAINDSLELAYTRLKKRCMPAAPSRRMDAGAIGSIAAGYPLKLEPARSPELLNTLEFLLDNCSCRGAFFQDMVHSGINPYLTLHLAQILMRAGDSRYADLRDAVAALATSTGQWPEAIHPRTGGGCMGDGQHAWAAAEFVSFMRHCFIQEEGRELVLGRGIDPAWLNGEETFGIWKAPTHFGKISLTCTHNVIDWKAHWHDQPDRIILALPGHPERELFGDSGTIHL
jgi:hypothetical protein